MPGHVPMMTAGSQHTSPIGPQLPCLIAWAAEATATNTAAKAAMRYSHRFQDLTAPPFCQAYLSPRGTYSGGETDMCGLSPDQAIASASQTAATLTAAAFRD